MHSNLPTAYQCVHGWWPAGRAAPGWPHPAPPPAPQTCAGGTEISDDGYHSRRKRAYNGRAGGANRCSTMLPTLQEHRLSGPKPEPPQVKLNSSLVNQRHGEVWVAEHRAAAHRCGIHASQRDVSAVTGTRQGGGLAIHLDRPAMRVGRWQNGWAGCGLDMARNTAAA